MKRLLRKRWPKVITCDIPFQVRTSCPVVVPRIRRGWRCRGADSLLPATVSHRGTDARTLGQNQAGKPIVGGSLGNMGQYSKNAAVVRHVRGSCEIRTHARRGAERTEPALSPHGHLSLLSVLRWGQSANRAEVLRVGKPALVGDSLARGPLVGGSLRE